MVVNILHKSPKTIVRILLMSFVIAGCIILDNYVDLPYSIKGESGSVYYYFFGSVSMGGLFGVYLLPALCVFPWYYRITEHKYERKSIISRILKSGATFASGYTMLIIILRLMGLPFLMDYETEGILESIAAGEVLPYTKLIANGKELLYFATAILFAFCEGCLSGAVAETAAFCTSDSSHAIISPVVSMVCLVYLGKYLQIPDDFRLDRWLLMRAEIDNSLLTVIVTVSITVVIVIISVFSLSGRKTYKTVVEHNQICHNYYIIGISAITMLIILLALNDKLSNINNYSESTSLSVTPFSFPFIIGESFFQMIYMIFYLAFVSIFTTELCKGNVLRIVSRLIIISLVLSGIVLLMSCFVLRKPEFKNDWKPVWSVFALRYSSYLPFDVPMTFIQNNSPVSALIISYILTNLCAVFLGTVYISGNAIRAGIGSIASVALTFLDITAYNLLEYKIWAYSPLSWAQYVDYDGNRNLNQTHVTVYCAVFLALICTNLVIYYFLKRRKIRYE